MPKTARLRKPQEFRRVYTGGKRFDGRYMTVFLLVSEIENHRLGITASKKAVGNAVSRNRAKRLLREVFRLSKAELNNLNDKYDWVINAKSSLSGEKLAKSLEDFRQIIKKVKNSESEMNRGEKNVVNESK